MEGNSQPHVAYARSDADAGADAGADADAVFTAAVLGRLSGLGCGVTVRRIGRLRGLFTADGAKMPFGIICFAELYLKAGPDAVTKYLARGMRPFRPGPRQALRGYWAVPPDVLEDPRQLTVWAGWAVAAARQFGRLRRPRPRRRPGQRRARRGADTRDAHGRQER